MPISRHQRRDQALAVGLAALAGYVDAIGFVDLGGFFVSFMSGNTTRLAVGLAHGSTAAAVAAGLIGTFVLGVAAGSLTGYYARRHRRVAVLLLVAVLLAGAALLAKAEERLAISLMALAMGAENAVFEHDGEVQIGLTYMTGTLVKLGQRLAAALRGGERFGWLSYLLLWFGLAAGAAAGATAFAAIGLDALWLAAAAALLFAMITTVFTRRGWRTV